MTDRALASVVGTLRPGARVLLQGGVGEHPGLIAALQDRPEAARGVEFWMPAIPGINRFDYTSLHETTRMVVFMATPEMAPGLRAGRVRILPLPYSRIGACLRQQRFDMGVFQTRPADRTAVRLSLSVAGDFAGLYPGSCDRVVILENPLLPDIARCEQVAVPGDAVRVEAPSDLHEPAPSRPAGAATLRAAHHARAFIDDGCAIQSGIGDAPARVIDTLGDARGLRIRSGIATGGYRKLFECGAVADGDHIAGIAWGDRSFLQWLAAEDPIAFAGVGRTHDIPALAREEKFTAINSAIEVDLFGQANVEWLGGRAVSGIGGALDFAQAAALSPQGRSLIVLPSVTASGASRIVARLSGPCISLPRGLVDIVVTEHGAADLRGLSTGARAKALARIAAAEHAEPLLAAARTIEG